MLKIEVFYSGNLNYIALNYVNTPSLLPSRRWDTLRHTLRDEGSCVFFWAQDQDAWERGDWDESLVVLPPSLLH